jgi:hypothetical protein
MTTHVFFSQIRHVVKVLKQNQRLVVPYLSFLLTTASFGTKDNFPNLVFVLCFQTNLCEILIPFL